MNIIVFQVLLSSTEKMSERRDECRGYDWRISSATAASNLSFIIIVRESIKSKQFNALTFDPSGNWIDRHHHHHENIPRAFVWILY